MKERHRDRRDRHKRPRRKQGFVAWDSESVNVEGRHVHAMLLSSNGTALVATTPAGLSTTQCLEAIIRGYERDPWKYHVGFAFGYDVNMILGDLPERQIRTLWKRGRCWWNGYAILYRNRKEFAVKRQGQKRYARVWDVFGFFQSSFVAALESYGVGDPAEIARMKAERPAFRWEDREQIRAYCAQECGYLVEMMDAFAGHLRTAELALTRYDGAGAVASALMRRHGVDRHKAETPAAVNEAARFAYFGGRIELVQFGHSRAPAYQYDVRSAYPSAMQHAPCLTCGSWHRGDGAAAAGDFALVRLRWALAGDVLPFPWRNRHGRVYFPRTGEAWVWECELQAARAALETGVIEGRVDVLDRLRYVTECGHAPFAWIPELYAQRAAWKRDGVGAEKVLKLGLNSLYGKCAQRVGGRDGRPPRWHQIEWAGWITARTRAALYVASLPAIRDRTLVMYATDALVTTAPQPLDIGTGLGQWEADTMPSVTAVQSGVYWLGRQKARTRGFGAEDVGAAAVLAAWRAGRETLPVSVTRFVGMGRATMGGAQWDLWRTWHTETRKLALWPYGTKRTLVRPGGRPARRLYWTTASREPESYQEAYGALSTARVLPWSPAGFDPASLDRDSYADRDSDDALV